MDLPPSIEWRVHLGSSPEEAFALWTSDAGRERFWAERSVAHASGFRLDFINGQSLDVIVEEAIAPERFVFRYFGGSRVTLEFQADGAGGCDLDLVEADHASAADRLENEAGWVSVLLGFKAALDFGIDLRAHDPVRTWERRYVDC
jgi:uncharacterized protein YndB with AHSA1/START domain